MEPIQKLKTRVLKLENHLRLLKIQGLLLDENLRNLRPAMDFSQFEWRETLPGKEERVWKDECALSFATPFSPGGLFINLKTLTAFSLTHVQSDWQNNNKHCIYLRQRWDWVPEENEQRATEEPEVKKLALGVEGGFQLEAENGRIHKTFSISCGPNFVEDYPIEIAPPNLRKLIDAVIDRDDASRQLDVMAWEATNDLIESKYARNLVQLDNGVKISSDPNSWRCAESGMTENLWLNLSTGYIGSGRANFDGTGGTGAAMKHYELNGRKYPLVVKLGTITADGKADVYSYAPEEDCMVTDPLLTKHLAHFGINVANLTKTDKTIAEMEVDLNAKYDWSRISEEGKQLERLSGPNCVGLVNIGNSCYCNSVYQSFFSSGAFTTSVLRLKPNLPSTNQPQFDVLQQFIKLGQALKDPINFVRPFSHKVFDGADYVTPRMLKKLLGENHPDFSTNEQQDAAEYALHILDRLSRAYRQTNINTEKADDLFKFEMEQRLQCLQSDQVRYQTSVQKMIELNVPYDPNNFGEKKEVRDVIPLLDCLKATLGTPEVIDDFLSPATGKRGQATKIVRFSTFPKLLLIKLRRFVPSPTGWEGIKLDCEIPPEITLDLGGPFEGHGLQEGEVLLPNEQVAVEPQFTPNPEVVNLITEQGFSRNAAIRAAYSTNNNLQNSVEWIMNHMNDPDLNSPMDLVPRPPKHIDFIPDPLIIESIEGMGFSRNGAIRACKATNNSMDIAINWVMEHMGDADFNDPLPQSTLTQTKSVSAPQNVSEETISMITLMGFDREMAMFALGKCQGNLERAADYLFSRSKEEIYSEITQAQASNTVTSPNTLIDSTAPAASEKAGNKISNKFYLRAVISHVGKSTSSGHYVAFINQSSPQDVSKKWVFFNDEKVCLSQNPSLDLGYLLMYEQLD